MADNKSTRAKAPIPAANHLRAIFDDSSLTQRQKKSFVLGLHKICSNLADPKKSLKDKHRVVQGRALAKLAKCPAAVDYLKAVGFQTETTGRQMLRMNHEPGRAAIRQSIRDITRTLVMIDPMRYMGYDVIALRKDFEWLPMI